MSRDEELLSRIEQLIQELLQLIGENAEREGLRETPKRVARTLLYELLCGYKIDPKQYLKSFSLDDADEVGVIKADSFVVVMNIPIRSLCEHHLLPIIGLAHIAYIPSERVLGISKFARIVDAFARRLQIQERFTDQIADFIYREISPEGVLVLTEAIHLCTIIRGIQEPLKSITIAHRGRFTKDLNLRLQALTVISMNRTRDSVLVNIEKYLSI